MVRYLLRAKIIPVSRKVKSDSAHNNCIRGMLVLEHDDVKARDSVILLLSMKETTITTTMTPGSLQIKRLGSSLTNITCVHTHTYTCILHREMPTVEFIMLMA